MKRLQKLRQMLVVPGLLGLGYLAGCLSPLSDVFGQAPTATAITAAPDATKRIVANIFGNVPITREEFGDYLINRYAAERLELFVNRRIIEHAATKKNIDCTELEISATIKEDCRLMDLTVQEFATHFLKNKNKTWSEWRDDVIKPRILLAKMYRDRITVTEEDLKKKFENKYGEKIKAKIIVWPIKEEKIAYREWDAIRKSDEVFDRKAVEQADGNLAARGGEIKPLARYESEDSLIEDEAFKLQPGEISRVIRTPVGFVVIKCTGRIEARKDVEFEKEKANLKREVTELKLSKDIGNFVVELQKEANAQFFLKPKEIKLADLDKDADVQAIEKEVIQTGGLKK